MYPMQTSQPEGVLQLKKLKMAADLMHFYGKGVRKSLAKAYIHTYIYTYVHIYRYEC